MENFNSTGKISDCEHLSKQAISYERAMPMEPKLTDQRKLLEKPRFDKRSVFAALIAWSLALLLVAFVYLFGARHPGVPGEKDLGAGVLVVGTIFVAIILFIGGVASMLLGLLHFLWVSWRFERGDSVGRAAQS